MRRARLYYLRELKGKAARIKRGGPRARRDGSRETETEPVAGALPSIFPLPLTTRRRPAAGCAKICADAAALLLPLRTQCPQIRLDAHRRMLMKPAAARCLVPVFAAAVILIPAPHRGPGRLQKTYRRAARGAGRAHPRARRGLAGGVGGRQPHRRLEHLPGLPPGHGRSRRWLSVQPDYLLIDAMHLDLMREQKPLINGDARSVSIAAASILAKVARDR